MTRARWMAALLLACCFLLSACAETAPVAEPAQNPLAEQFPVEKKDAYGFYFGLNAAIKGASLVDNQPHEGDVSFHYSGGDVQATLFATNALEGTLQGRLLVLCDGIPVAFASSDGASTRSLAMDFCGETVFSVRFQPSFSLGLGRIDFCILFGESGNAIWHTVFALSDEPFPSVEAEGTRVSASIVPRRDAVARAVQSQEPTVNNVMTWVCSSDMDLSRCGVIAAGRPVALHNDRTLRLEGAAALTGTYRTLILMDEQPEDAGCLYVDWSVAADEMMSMPLSLPTWTAASGRLTMITLEVESAASMPYVFVSSPYTVTCES